MAAGRSGGRSADLGVHSAVRLDVMLGGVLGVLEGVEVVAVGEVRMVGGRLVFAIQVMLGGFAVMTRSVLVMFRCLTVMMSCFVGHRKFPLVVPVASRHVRIIPTLDRRPGYGAAKWL